MILDWMFYHGIMYRFVIRHWHEKTPDHMKLAAQRGIVSKAIFAPERKTVRSSLLRPLPPLDILVGAIHMAITKTN